MRFRGALQQVSKEGRERKIGGGFGDVPLRGNEKCLLALLLCNLLKRTDDGGNATDDVDDPSFRQRDEVAFVSERALADSRSRAMQKPNRLIK